MQNRWMSILAPQPVANNLHQENARDPFDDEEDGDCDSGQEKKSTGRILHLTAEQQDKLEKDIKALLKTGQETGPEIYTKLIKAKLVPEKFGIPMHARSIFRHVRNVKKKLGIKPPEKKYITIGKLYREGITDIEQLMKKAKCKRCTVWRSLHTLGLIHQRTRNGKKEK